MQAPQSERTSADLQIGFFGDKGQGNEAKRLNHLLSSLGEKGKRPPPASFIPARARIECEAPQSAAHHNYIRHVMI